MTIPLRYNAKQRRRSAASGPFSRAQRWTAVGVRSVDINHRVIAACRLQDVDPSVYLVAVFQRIDTHPAIKVHLLTPRLWQQHFAATPLRSALDRLGP